MVNSKKVIEEFREFYRSKVINYLNSFNTEQLQEITETIKKAVKIPRNTIYIFGNGGSYAIAKHFDLSLKTMFRGAGYGIKTNTGINFDESQQLALEYGYEQIFVQILKDELANQEDLVILISGSGNSNNVIEAAKYCNDHKIPNLSFSGFDGGEIAKISTKASIVKINDQQISEDIIQSLLHLCIKLIKNSVSKEDYISQLNEGLERLSSYFLDKITNNIVDAYLNDKGVYILAPEGNGLSISAEHTAHNLNWDAIYGLKNPPTRKIYSTPTNSDYSGIGNDRTAEGIVTIQQLEKAKKGEILLLYSQNIKSKAVSNVLTEARKKGLETYIVSGVGKESDVEFGTIDPFVTADLMQMVGHMIGRITNYKLKQKLGYKTNKDDLMNKDLAQRRLIGVKHGL